MCRGSGHTYCVKWTNLSEELICDYGANHRLFRDPSKERPPKVQKIRGPQRISADPVRSSPPVPDTTDILELHPSSGEESESDIKEQQIPGIFPMQLDANVLRMVPSFKCLDRRIPGLISSHIALCESNSGTN